MFNGLSLFLPKGTKGCHAASSTLTFKSLVRILQVLHKTLPSLPKSGPFELKKKPEEKEKKKKRESRATCSQCKPFSTRAWSPSGATKSIPNTPVRRRSPSSALATSSTKASLASVRAPRAWISSRTVIAGRGRLVGALFARQRIRRRSCAICRGRRFRRWRRRGGNGGRCEYFLSLSLFSLDLFSKNADEKNRTGNIYAPSGDAVSNADTTTYVSGTLASATTVFPNTPIPDIHISSSSSVRPSPDATGATTEAIHTQNATTTMTTTTPPPASETACLERVTALENQVSNLEAKVVELVVRLDEVSSCVGSSPTPAR